MPSQNFSLATLLNLIKMSCNILDTQHTHLDEGIINGKDMLNSVFIKPFFLLSIVSPISSFYEDDNGTFRLDDVFFVIHEATE